LVGRVVGKETKTGIYKITNTLDNRVYIGQAVNIAERWKQHIKRALGAEPMTQNKLYPAMRDEGVWYFTFEIVEVCEKAQLNEREQYWQEFFGAKEFGYSIK
jgi:group I intron endonuclease